MTDLATIFHLRGLAEQAAALAAREAAERAAAAEAAYVRACLAQIDATGVNTFFRD